MLEELETISEECGDISYHYGDMDALVDAFDGDEEEAFEFRYAFTDLSANCDSLMEQLWGVDRQEYDDCTVALIGNRYNMIGWDDVEEDYYSLTSYDAELANTDAGKRLMRHTKAEMIAIIGQSVGTLLAYLDLRQQYDYLKATMDVLRGNNRAILGQIKRIEELYEKVTVQYPASEDVRAFDAVLELLPERMWIE